MQCVTGKDVKKLAEEPINFAMMMENHQLEHVIVVFVSVLNKRKKDRGG
jgi:hypothetical protein